MATLHRILFQNPPSSYLTITGIINPLVSLLIAYSEVKGSNLPYSKFAPKKQANAKTISSRIGMLIAYGPALVASVMFLIKFNPSAGFLSTSPRLSILASALTIHFLKRELEVLFVHQYSGSAPLQTALTISFSYFLQAFNLMYAQNLSEAMQPPALDLMWVGVGLFFIGIGGNFYHHYLLAALRKDGKRGYKVPQGGLFNFVVCPHYLFEIVIWLGMALISQTAFSFINVCCTLLYLMGRSYATRQWYLQKIENFPNDRKALFPFLF